MSPRQNIDETMMDRALALARAAGEKGEVPIGAVVYRLKDGAVLGEGANSREGESDPCGHAEIAAIRAAARAVGDWRLTGCGIAVTLEPCPMCAGAIVNARLERVVYGAADPKAGAVRTLMNLVEDPRLNHRVREIVAGVREEECAGLLRGFFASRRGGS